MSARICISECKTTKKTVKKITYCVREKFSYIQTHTKIGIINFVHYNLSYKILWMAAFILSKKDKLLKLQKEL